MKSKYLKDMDYKLVSRKSAYNGRRIKVEELEYLNGDKKIYREHVKAGNAVAILPITNDNKVIMIRETRTPIGKTILALPAGMIEENEESEKAAIRELEEETGYLAGNVKFLKEYYPSVGYSDEKIAIYLAENMKRTKQHLDEEEEIEVVELPIEEVIEMLDNNELVTACANIALLYYLRHEKK